MAQSENVSGRHVDYVRRDDFMALKSAELKIPEGEKIKIKLVEETMWLVVVNNKNPVFKQSSIKGV